MAIENTSERDPLLHFLGLLSEGQDDYIRGMEKQGQTQLVNSDQLPTQGIWSEVEALGVIRGEEADDLFTHVTLPEGWTRTASDHDMWSDILDERGIKRIAVGYKAAFYDRWATFHVINVGVEAASDMIWNARDGGDISLPESWSKMTREEREETYMTAHRRLGACKEDVVTMGHDDYWVQKLADTQRVVDFLEGVDLDG